MNDVQSPKRRAVSIALLWGMIVPQLLLLCLNWHAWTLIRGEAQSDESTTALVIALLEIALILALTVVWWRHRQGKLELTWRAFLVSLITHAAYLWLFLIYVSAVVPSTVQPWIVSEGHVGRWVITLLMPGAFLSLYALTNAVFSGMSKANARLTLYLGTLGAPILWYLSVTLLQPLWHGQLTVVLSIVFGTSFVILFLAAIIRIFDKLLHRVIADSVGIAHYLAAAVLGLAAPFGGLLLNREIPFPVDFQSDGVYLLTLINGLLLLVKPKAGRFTIGRLFLRCLLLPFIFYFFLVFLPFLPLSLFAIFAMGAGFLMLTPLALGLFQARITLQEFALAERRRGRIKTGLIALTGLAVLPFVLVLEASNDKAALGRTLAFFYSHDIRAEKLSMKDINRSAKALVQLRDRKADIQLPYIAGIYNAIVFGDLVLTDEKIVRMHQWLTGAEPPRLEPSLFGSNPYRGRPLFRPRVVPPHTDVSLENIELKPRSKTTASLKLDLRNASEDTHALYSAPLKLPDGVFVTGMRLKIENEWVKAQIFDRKTALWVFQKITEVRRDPAIIHYLSKNEAELRVYPFPPQGLREVEIDFTYHPNIDAALVVDGRHIDLNPDLNLASLIAASGEVLVDAGMQAFAFTRDPYLHFVLDYSASSTTTAEGFAKIIARVAADLDIDQCRVSAANIDTASGNTANLLPAQDTQVIMRAIKKIDLAKRGGFWLEQALAKSIQHTAQSLDQSNLERRPVFVVVSENVPQQEIDDLVLDAWSWQIPDMTGWYAANGASKTWYALSSDNASITPKVVALEHDNGLSIWSAEHSSIVATNNDAISKIYDPNDASFSRLSPRSAPPSPWIAYASMWSDWREAKLNPAEFEKQRAYFLKQSRSSELLLPETAFIVVENSAQWEIMRRKEKQALENHSALEFEEEQQTPEPHWWLLLAVLLLFVYRRDTSLRA